MKSDISLIINRSKYKYPRIEFGKNTLRIMLNVCCVVNIFILIKLQAEATNFFFTIDQS